MVNVITGAREKKMSHCDDTFFLKHEKTIPSIALAERKKSISCVLNGLMSLPDSHRFVLYYS